MGHLVAVVGSSGVGKTTLVRLLNQSGQFAFGLEEHDLRPFQELAFRDRHFTLANQVDYFLFRAEQEQYLRGLALPGLIDGGLDLDFHAFTRLFHEKGYLDEAEYRLCERLFAFIRSYLPLPELFLQLVSTPEVIRERLARRERINIANSDDIHLMDRYINEWLTTLEPDQYMRLDVSNSDPGFSHVLPAVLDRINSLNSNYLI